MVIVAILAFALAVAAMSAFDAGNLVAQKIRVQNAADAAAITGATWQARLLNLIACMNQITMGCYVGLFGSFAAGMVAGVVAAFFGFPNILYGVLKATKDSFELISNYIRPIIFNAQKIVLYMVPVICELSIIAIGARNGVLAFGIDFGSKSALKPFFADSNEQADQESEDKPKENAVLEIPFLPQLNLQPYDPFSQTNILKRIAKRLEDNAGTGQAKPYYLTSPPPMVKKEGSDDLKDLAESVHNKGDNAGADDYKNLESEIDEFNQSTTGSSTPVEYARVPPWPKEPPPQDNVVNENIKKPVEIDDCFDVFTMTLNLRMSGTKPVTKQSLYWAFSTNKKYYKGKNIKALKTNYCEPNEWWEMNFAGTEDQYDGSSKDVKFGDWQNSYWIDGKKVYIVYERREDLAFSFTEEGVKGSPDGACQFKKGDRINLQDYLAQKGYAREYTSQGTAKKLESQVIEALKLKGVRIKESELSSYFSSPNNHNVLSVSENGDVNSRKATGSCFLYEMYEDIKVKVCLNLELTAKPTHYEVDCDGKMKFEETDDFSTSKCCDEYRVCNLNRAGFCKKTDSIVYKRNAKDVTCEGCTIPKKGGGCYAHSKSSWGGTGWQFSKPTKTPGCDEEDCWVYPYYNLTWKFTPYIAKKRVWTDNPHVKEEEGVDLSGDTLWIRPINTETDSQSEEDEEDEKDINRKDQHKIKNSLRGINSIYGDEYLVVVAIGKEFRTSEIFKNFLVPESKIFNPPIFAFSAAAPYNERQGIYDQSPDYKLDLLLLKFTLHFLKPCHRAMLAPLDYLKIKAKLNKIGDQFMRFN